MIYKSKIFYYKIFILFIFFIINFINKTFAYKENIIDTSIYVNWEVFVISTTIPYELYKKWIKNVIWIWQSNFWNSIPSRIQNIKAALNKIDWTIVDTWEIFSYNKTLWALTANNWFTVDQIISWWSITWAMWWWVCQLSTTILRSAINSWLKINKFRNHSIAIPYYLPYWLDSAVYSATDLDLKFINDTSTPIYIKIFIIENELISIFYWSDDWRNVLLEWPYIDWIKIEENDLKKFNYKNFTVEYNRKIYHKTWDMSEEIFSSKYLWYLQRKKK